MLGAIAGDVIGSAYEAGGYKDYDFVLFSEYSRFTDDSVMSVAIAGALLEGRDYADAMVELGQKHPFAGYGKLFQEWLFAPETGPYNSWGNGSAMRVSPIGFAGSSEGWVVREAERTAAVTHNHPEGIRGAQAIALSVFLAREGKEKEEIRAAISDRFGYEMNRSVDGIRPGYTFDVSCPGSVPESIICFLDSHDFESAIRNAVSLGGDTDTMACMAGAIAQAFYGGIPEEIRSATRERLPSEFLDVVDRFSDRFGISDEPL
jgi:ADP-ribosylglycohydrolase